MLPDTWLGEWKLAEVEKKNISMYGLVYKELWPARGHLRVNVICLLYDRKWKRKAEGRWDGETSGCGLPSVCLE